MIHRVIIPFALLAAMVISLAPAAAQSEASHQQFLFAYKLMQRGDDRLAAEAFDEFLGRFPEDEKRADALYYRALLFRRTGDNERAAATLEAVARGTLEPTLVPGYAPKLLYGQVLADLNRPTEAVAALDAIPTDELAPPLAASVLYLKGLAAQRAGNTDAAAAALRAASQLDAPLKPRATMDLARVLAASGDPAAAYPLLDTAAELADAANTPEIAAESLRLAGDLHLRGKEHDPALAAYARVITEHPTSREYVPAVHGTLWTLLDAGRYEAIVEAFTRYRDTLPTLSDRVPAFYVAGSALQELAEHEAAVNVLEQISAGEGGHPLQERSMYKLAVSQHALTRWDAMRETLTRFARLFPESSLRAEAASMLADADVARGDPDAGIARLTEVARSDDPEVAAEAVLRRARLNDREDRVAAAAADYVAFVTAEFKRRGREATRDERVHAAGLRVADLAYRLERYDKSLEWAQLLRTYEPLTPEVEREAMYREALAQVKLNQAAEALATLNALDERFPRHPYAGPVAYYRGLLLVRMEKPDAAMEPLASAAADASLPASLRINAMRLRAIRQRDDPEQAPQAARTLLAMQELGGVEPLTDSELLWLAEYLVKVGESDAALRYTAPLTAADGRTDAPPAMRARAWRATGEAQRVAGRLDAAIEAFSQAVALAGGGGNATGGEGAAGTGIRAQLGLAQTLAEAGRAEEALNELRGLVNVGDRRVEAEALYETAAVLTAEAEREVRAGDLPEARQAVHDARVALKKLAFLFGPDNAAVYALVRPLPEQAQLELASLAERFPQFTEADDLATAYRELARSYPDTPYAAFASAMLQERAGARQRDLKTLQQRDDLDPVLRARVEAAMER